MNSDLRLQSGLAVLGAVLVVGTIGYVFIEDLSVVDGFYMTAITISTVGFGEVGGELTSAGRYSPSASSSSAWAELSTLPRSASNRASIASSVASASGGGWNTRSRGCAITSFSAGSAGSQDLLG